MRTLGPITPMTYAAMERALTELGFVKTTISEPEAAIFEHMEVRTTVILPVGEPNEQVEPLDIIKARRTVFETGIATLEEFAAVVERAIRAVTPRRITRRKRLTIGRRTGNITA